MYSNVQFWLKKQIIVLISTEENEIQNGCTVQIFFEKVIRLY